MQQGRDVKALDAEILEARVEAAKRVAQEKAEADAMLASENKLYRARVAEAGTQGRDVKHLEPETEVARVLAAEQSMADRHDVKDMLSQVTVDFYITFYQRRKHIVGLFRFFGGQNAFLAQLSRSEVTNLF
jgi:transcription elongation GreA/GreB family factor